MATIKKELLIPVGETIWCEKCYCDMECVEENKEEEKYVYMCPICKEKIIVNTFFPKIQYYTKEDLQEEIEKSPSFQTKREEMVKEALKNRDFETLKRLGVKILPLFIDTKYKS